MSEPSETPRTDASKRYRCDPDTEERGYVVPADDCADIERDLAAVTAERDAAQALCDQLRDSEIDKLMKLTDEQVSALSGMQGHNPDDEARLSKQAFKLAEATVKERAAKRRIAELEAERDSLLASMRILSANAEEVMRSHRDPHSSAYNECEKPGEECMWCATTRAALAPSKEPSDDHR